MLNSIPRSLIESARKVLLKENTETLPVADISHHHCNKLKESHINDWVNKGIPEWDEESYHNIHDLDNIHGEINYYDHPDKYADLANNHAMNLDNDHYQAVQNYVTGGLEDGDESGSMRVNKHLIESHNNKIEPQKSIHLYSDPHDEEYDRVLHIDHLDDALKQNKLDKQLKTYSGIGFNPAKLISHEGLLHLPAYTSSSTHKGVSLLYAKPDENNDRHVLEITHPKGSTGLYMGDNEDFTPFMQKEHLSPRGMTIKIDKEPETHEDSYGNILHIWKGRRLLSKEKK